VPVALVAFDDDKLNRAQKTTGAVVGAEAADTLDGLFHALQGSPGEPHSFVVPVTVYEKEEQAHDRGTGLRRFITVYRPAGERKSVEIQIFKPTDHSAAKPYNIWGTEEIEARNPGPKAPAPAKIPR
jgi:hypothetical protein